MRALWVTTLCLSLPVIKALCLKTQLGTEMFCIFYALKKVQVSILVASFRAKCFSDFTALALKLLVFKTTKHNNFLCNNFIWKHLLSFRTYLVLSSVKLVYKCRHLSYPRRLESRVSPASFPARFHHLISECEGNLSLSCKGLRISCWGLRHFSSGRDSDSNGQLKGWTQFLL